MSRNIQTVTKWLPVNIIELEKVYEKCAELQKTAHNLLERICCLLGNLKKKCGLKIQHNMQNELNIQELEDICVTMDQIVLDFSASFQKVSNNNCQLVAEKNKMWKNIIWEIKLKICYYVQELIHEVCFLFIYYGEILLILTLKLSQAYNNLYSMDTKFGIKKNMSFCNNSCSYLLFPTRKISITRILQIIASSRAELCCHKLIDCLLETYKSYETNEDDTTSDNSSIEIYKALTKHMSPINSHQPHQNKPIEEEEDDTTSNIFPSIEELIAYEEKNVLDLLQVTTKIYPTLLGSDGLKKSKTSGDTKVSSKARDKVLEYYEQILWGEVGNFLEHIILWWGASPLSARPPHSSQHLREWIIQFIPTAETKPVVLSALTSLADALGVHVTLTSWDQLFRMALVATKTFNPETGKLFGGVLQDLVMLSNQCEVTPDWIVGAPLDELPLVEQIPVLHRLDHSIHTMRLWSCSETKRIANTWNVAAFFNVTHSDITNCLHHLNNLRLNDHTISIDKGGLAVHVQVCSLMRAKLASEVHTNISKLKDTPNECLQNLASICRTISLANLQMIFPGGVYWSRVESHLPKEPSPYIDKYLGQILSPILEATEDPLITNMILRILCESWLDHIYLNKIKFSQFGAYQLLCDFGYIEVWLRNSTNISNTLRQKMVKNEVLKRCEGVGRLLLRCPGEQIPMVDRNKPISSTEGAEMMPAEMYVPNQEQWLELRVIKKRNLLTTSLCCGKF